MSEPAPAALIVIPARFASSRLPGKPLLEAEGKTLVQHVWERACQIRAATAVVVATDDERIADVVRAFGGEVVMTSAECASGTDRVAQVARTRTEELVVNLQGDEPEFEPGDVDALLDVMARDPSLPMGTLAVLTDDEEERALASVVKVVRDLSGRALYFSRATIPHERDPRARDRNTASGGGGVSVLRHIGIYAFRREAVLRFAALQPTPLERAEKLEQLRALENGWHIAVVTGAVVTGSRVPRGIDTPADFEEFCRRLRGASGETAQM